LLKPPPPFLPLIIGIPLWAWEGFPLTSVISPPSFVHRFLHPHSGQCHSTPPSMDVWMVFQGVALTGINTFCFSI